MAFRISGYARKRMHQRHVPEDLVTETYEDPDGTDPTHDPDREVRWRMYDGQRIEIVIDLIDGSVVSVWITRVSR
jgi:hypothetical protein